MLSSIGSLPLLSIELSSIFSIQILCLCYLSSYLNFLIKAYFNGTDAFFCLNYSGTGTSYFCIITFSINRGILCMDRSQRKHTGIVVVGIFSLLFIKIFSNIYLCYYLFVHFIFAVYHKLSSIVNRSTLQLYIIYSCLVIL